MSEVRKCVESSCGHAEFELSDDDLAYFNSTIKDKVTGEEIQMKPPKRCPECRARLKKERKH